MIKLAFAILTSVVIFSYAQAAPGTYKPGSTQGIFKQYEDPKAKTVGDIRFKKCRYQSKRYKIGEQKVLRNEGYDGFYQCSDARGNKKVSAYWLLIPLN